jgi:phosphoribosyl 1,2-cyclic phosphate phosphodiesterase
VLKDGFKLKEDNPLNEELFSIKEIESLKNKYSIGKVVITHIEEDWGKSYDDYIQLQKKYDNIIFAFDGLVIDI